MSGRWLVDVPEGEQGGVRVQRFTVDREDLRGLVQGRYCPKGTYTRLIIDGGLWMSDTPAEQRDHYEAAYQIRNRGGRILIMGLGLGMVVKQALAVPHVEHVDVIESNPDVIALVGPHYACDRLTIHEGDAFTFRWPVGSHWQVVWHDIWRDLSEDNLDEITRLKRSYGRRCHWQGAWGQDTLLRDRRRYG